MQNLEDELAGDTHADVSVGCSIVRITWPQELSDIHENYLQHATLEPRPRKEAALCSEAI